MREGCRQVEAEVLCNSRSTWGPILLATPVYWAKTPPFYEGSWERGSPRTSKTVRGTRAKRRVPRTVFEVRGLHLFQRSRGKGGVLSLYPGYAGLPLEQGFSENVASWARCITLRKTWHLGSTVFQDTSHFEKRGILKNSTPKMPCFPKCDVILENNTPKMAKFQFSEV